MPSIKSRFMVNSLVGHLCAHPGYSLVGHLCAHPGYSLVGHLCAHPGYKVSYTPIVFAAHIHYPPIQ